MSDMKPFAMLRGSSHAISASCLLVDEELGNSCLLLAGDVSGALHLWSVDKLQMVKANVHMEHQVTRQAQLDDGSNGVVSIHWWMVQRALVQYRSGLVLLIQFTEDLKSLFRIQIVSCGSQTDRSFCRMAVQQQKERMAVVHPNALDFNSFQISIVSMNAAAADSVQSLHHVTCNHGLLTCLSVIERSTELIVCAGFDDGTVVVFSLIDGELKEMASFAAFHLTVTAVALYELGNQMYLAASGPDAELLLVCGIHSLTESLGLDPAVAVNESDVIRIALPQRGVSDVLMCLDSTTNRLMLVTAGWDGVVRFFSLSNSDLVELFTSSVHFDTITSLKLQTVSVKDPFMPWKFYRRVLLCTSKDCVLSLYSL